MYLLENTKIHCYGKFSEGVHYTVDRPPSVGDTMLLMYLIGLTDCTSNKQLQHRFSSIKNNMSIMLKGNFCIFRTLFFCVKVSNGDNTF